MAWNTAIRKPVSTSTVMTRPSSTTRPIASAQLIRLAIANVTKALRPSPVAIANGYRPTTPMSDRQHGRDQRGHGRDLRDAEHAAVGVLGRAR